jgi:hypothetical protein
MKRYEEKPREVAPEGPCLFQITGVELKTAQGGGSQYLRLSCTHLPSGIPFTENLSLGAKSEWKVTKFSDSIGLLFTADGSEADVIASIGDMPKRVGFAILKHETTNRGNPFADVLKFLTPQEALEKHPELKGVELRDDAETEPVEYRPMRVKPTAKKVKVVAEELEQAVL